MFRFLIYLSLCTSIFAAPAGLRIPAWHEGKITMIDTPELNQEFQIQFELSANYTNLENIKVAVIPPTNLRLIKGLSSHKPGALSATSVYSTTWTFIADGEIDGISLRVQVDLDTPIMGIKKKIKEIYSKDPAHQLDQLIKFVESFKPHTQSVFSAPLFIFQTEGLQEARPLHFRKKVALSSYTAPLICFDLPILNSKEDSETILRLNQGAQFFEGLRLNPETRVAAAEKNPGMIRRMLEDHSYLSYQLAYSAFTRKDYDSCEQLLRNLTALLMTEADFSYDFFLAIQNLRAIAWLAQGKTEQARNTLTTSIRTASDSKVRHYLQYNLAVVYHQDKNMAQRDHYLIEALRLSPGFSLAKQLSVRMSPVQPKE